MAAEGLEVLQPELGAGARVYYRNLYRWTKAFIGGTAVYAASDECAEGIRATVTADGVVVGEAFSNNYGDFVVDRLEPGEREYELVLEAAGYLPVRRTVRLEASVNLGVLLLAGA